MCVLITISFIACLMSSRCSETRSLACRAIPDAPAARPGHRNHQAPQRCHRPSRAPKNRLACTRVVKAATPPFSCDVVSQLAKSSRVEGPSPLSVLPKNCGYGGLNDFARFIKPVASRQDANFVRLRRDA